MLNDEVEHCGREQHIDSMQEIYNHYIDTSIFAHEFDGGTEKDMCLQINTITQAGLPYLVAVARGNQPRGKAGYVNEKIVGFINLDDAVDQSSMFRYTFEMQLYVHPGFLEKNIAMCLLDKLLEMVNTGYNVRGGYDYVNEFEYLKTGPSRVVKTILLDVHHEHGKELGWQTKFLSAFKFVRCGRMPQVGYKHNKIIDVSKFCHHTTETINPSGIPSVARGHVGS